MFFFACSNKKEVKNDENSGIPKFAILPEIHNFGQLEAGEVSYFSFKITNSGTGDLTIDSINTGCGCIEVEWNNEIVKSGESKFMKVFFNSAGEWGNIYKPITIYTNTEKRKKEIFLTAKVNNSLFN